MGQEIIKIEDIVGGDNLAKIQELNEFVKKNEVGTAAFRDEDYFAKSDEVPSPPQYTLKIKREDIVWTDDYITIPHSTYLSDKKIEVYKVLLRKGSGDIVLNPRVSYPRSETYNSAPPNEFYLKDGDGYITKGNDFEYLHLEYSVFPSWEVNNYDLRNGIGRNVIQDENSGEANHSFLMKTVFNSIFPDLWEEYGISCIESIKDPLSGRGSIGASFEPKFMELKKANMLFRPYVNGASSEQISSNPNILKVGSHYGNWDQVRSQQEINLTPADDIFLTNSIAVAARGDFEAANTEYVPDISGHVGRYGWTKLGWTGDFETGFTHTPGNTSPLSRPCFIKFTTSKVRKYWVDFVVTGRTAGAFTVSLNLQESSPYTESGRFELTTTSLNGRVLTITPTSDFDGKISVRCNMVLNQSSFGRGLEFSEDINKGEVMDTPIPDSWVPYAMICTNEDGSIIKSTIDTSGNPYNPDWTEKFEVGEMVEIRTNPIQTVEVAEILGVNSIRITTPITPIINATGNPYIWRFTTNQTLHSIIGYDQQQSPACSIVGAKLKKIELLTGVNLQIVREAARATAKKTVNGVFGNHPGHWDKYRGFGQIYPDDAIQYIKDNYTENPDWIATLADDVDRTRGINPMLSYDSINDNTPVPKRLMREVTENNYTDKDKAKLDTYPELTGVASDGFVNAAGEIQQIAVAVGGFANNLYFSNIDSDVAGYKALVYDLPATETVISHEVSNRDGEVLVGSHLYPDPVSADIYPSGLWSFEFYGRVSSAVGTTQIGVRYFRYTLSNEKVYLFPAIVWSNAIDNTVNNWIPISVQQPSFAVQTGDRMGCDIFVKSTSVATRTVYYTLGDGYASYLNNPNAVRHHILRAKNEELAYQHVNTTKIKKILTDDDSIAILNGLTGEVIVTPLNDLYNYIVNRINA